MCSLLVVSHSSVMRVVVQPIQYAPCAWIRPGCISSMHSRARGLQCWFTYIPFIRAIMVFLTRLRYATVVATIQLWMNSPLKDVSAQPIFSDISQDMTGNRSARIRALSVQHSECTPDE
jgi:hypothetical protein